MSMLQRALAWTVVATVGGSGCVLPERDVGSELDASGTGTGGSSESGSTVSATGNATMSTTDASTSTTTSITTSTSTTVEPEDTGAESSSSSTDPTGECPPGAIGCACSDAEVTCDEGLLCTDGVCQDPTACEDIDGSGNNSEMESVELEGLDCFQEPMSHPGALVGLDVDWFVYPAGSGGGCTDDVRVEVTSESTIGVCVFAECAQGSGTVSCSVGAEEDASPDGRDGCCDDNQASLDHDCVNGATIFVRLTATDDACTPYELQWQA